MAHFSNIHHETSQQHSTTSTIQRYSSSLIYTSLSGMPPRKKKIVRPLVEYDPTLPPAAFPTLDIQRERRSSYAKGIHGRDSLPSNNLSQTLGSSRRDGQDGVEAERVDFEGIPPDLLEKYAASNGEHNPVYVRNMAILGALKGDSTSSLEKEMEDSDVEVAANSNEQQRCPEAPFPIPDPSWKGLCPQMQVEIFVNLLHYYKWWDATEILGLAVEDHEELRKLLAKRDEQVNLEDAQLAEMRERQLGALLMIDHSNRKYGQSSPDRVFDGVSQETSRILKKRLEIDYLACPAKDIAYAKLFLQKRGIDDRFVGEWADCINPLEPSRDYTALKTLPSGELESKTTISTDSLTPSSGKLSSSSKNTQHSPDNAVKSTSAMRTTDRLRSRADSGLPSQWVTLLQQKYSHAIEAFQSASQNDGLIRLQVNAERAAHVQKPDGVHSEPARLWHEYPPLDLFFYEPPSPNLSTSDKNPIPEPNTDSNGQSQLESMCETQSDSAPVPGMAPLVSSSMRLQQRSEEARLESWREKPDDSYDTDISELDDGFAYLYATPSRSRSRSPGIMSPDDDQESINFSDWVRSSAYNSDSDDRESDVLTEMSDEENTATSPVTPRTLDSLSGLLLSTEDKSPLTEEEDVTEEEDEMVLVPEGPFIR